MPTYIVTAPDGKEYEIEGEGTQEEALAHFQSQWNSQPASKPHLDPNSPSYGQAPVDPSLYDQADIRKNKMLQTVREVARQTGRGLTGLADGVMALPRMVANIPSTAINALGGNMPTFPPLQSASPEFAPKNDTEVFADKLTTGLGATAGGIGLGGALTGTANQTAQGIGRVMASRPAVQATSAVTGTAGSELARQSGGGPVAEFVGGLGGAMLPGVVASGAPALTRAGFRGGEAGRQRVEENLRMFEEAGATPTVGQATESRMMRGAESLLSRTPGGAGRMAATAEAQADDLGAAIEKRAAQLAKKTSGEQAGRKIQRGISGEGGFIERFKAQQGELYDELDKFIPQSARIDVSSTRKALDDLNQNIEGAKNVSKFFQNSKIKGIRDALEADASAAGSSLENAATGQLPYEAVKKLRTLVGREMADSGIASDVPRSKWKALYGALSSDLEKAVKGNKPAEAAWSRANSYTKAGMQRIEAIESVIDRNGGPEAIFRAATSNTREGATTLRAVMQSLDGEGQKTVSATVLRRLGIANPSNQNELGERFSTSTFLTNWNKLSPEAKRTLFDRYGPTFREDMNQIAKITGNLREGSKVFQNPSGTEQATAQAATVGGFALSLLTGQVQAAATIAAGVGGANLMSRLMTNPRFVRWLAQSTRHPLAHAPSMIANLANQAEGDEDIAMAVAILEQQQSKQD